MIFQKVIVRAKLYGFPSRAFIFRASQDQDGKQRSGSEDRCKCVDTLTVGQG